MWDDGSVEDAEPVVADVAVDGAARVRWVAQLEHGQAGARTHVGDLVKLLREHNLGAAVVFAGGRHVTGIVSERDVVRNLNVMSDLLERPVSSIMSAPRCGAAAVPTAAPNVMSVMTERRVRHARVVDDDGDVLVG